MSLPQERALALLREGEIEVLGMMPRASNHTFAVQVSDGSDHALAVYKPRDGETPLWDFPEGTLYKREIAAYELSEALGLGFVPATVVREGPFGIGSLQLFVEADFEQHYLTLAPGREDLFRLVAAFDVVANNADRKSGHCLLEPSSGRVFMVDHGVCFHAEPKLRTVIWDHAGEPLGTEARAAVAKVPEARRRLEPWLVPEETDALEARARQLLAAGALPEPSADHRPYPWPPI